MSSLAVIQTIHRRYDCDFVQRKTVLGRSPTVQSRTTVAAYSAWSSDTRSHQRPSH